MIEVQNIGIAAMLLGGFMFSIGAATWAFGVFDNIAAEARYQQQLGIAAILLGGGMFSIGAITWVFGVLVK